MSRRNSNFSANEFLIDFLSFYFVHSPALSISIAIITFLFTVWKRRTLLTGIFCARIFAIFSLFSRFWTMSASYSTSAYLKKGSGMKYIKNRPYTANSYKRVSKYKMLMTEFLWIIKIDFSIFLQVVPPFSIQTLQRNTITMEPHFPKTCNFRI